MIVVQGTARVRAEDVERVRAMAVWFLPAVREEDGCLHYAFAHDILDPTVIQIVQRWQDEAALEAHMRTPHAVRLNEFLRKIMLTELLVKSYDASGENIILGG